MAYLQTPLWMMLAACADGKGTCSDASLPSSLLQRQVTAITMNASATKELHSYDEDEAKLLFEYGLASYCNESRILSWKCGRSCEAARVEPGKIRFLSHTRKKVQGYVAQIPIESGTVALQASRCVVAFRGTEAYVTNAVSDFSYRELDWPVALMSKAKAVAHYDKFRVVPCHGCRVHKGFAEDYEALREAMFEAIESLGCKSIRFTGHSLGAALATLASVEARQIPGMHVDTTYTFGSPRVGNRDFVRAYTQAADKDSVEPAMFRVVDEHDCVAHLPPTWLAPYHHIPVEVFYSNHFKNYRVRPQNLEQTITPATTLDCFLPVAHSSYLGISIFGWNFPKECGRATAT